MGNRLQIAKEKAEYKSRDYNALNEELIRDIPVLLKDRSRFFDGLFANLVQGQAQYLVEAARAMNIIGPSLEHVDRTRAASWPFSITEPSRSAFAGSTVLPDGPTFTSSHAPVQAPVHVVPQLLPLLLRYNSPRLCIPSKARTTRKFPSSLGIKCRLLLSRAIGGLVKSKEPEAIFHPTMCS